MRFLIIAISMLIFPVITNAQINMGISIGVNVPTYPDLVPVPGYPVYYDPSLDSNYFFYDGQYWVYNNDNWYSSDWYNGPWQMVDPESVPLFVLRVPVRYYRQPPTYFNGWRADAAPHWGEHWGQGWEAHHRGWSQWNHQAAPRPAPLPTYQRQYSGDRYPHGDEQHTIRNQNYHYQPHNSVVQQRPQNNAQKDAVSRPTTPHQQTAIQHQTPQPQHTQQAHQTPPPRTAEQFHPQPGQSPASPVRPASPPPAQAEQHAQSQHMQPAHPQQQRPPAPAHNDKPHDDHERDNKDHDNK